jgi:hypothetical protein
VLWLRTHHQSCPELAVFERCLVQLVSQMGWKLCNSIISPSSTKGLWGGAIWCGQRSGQYADHRQRHWWHCWDYAAMVVLQLLQVTCTNSYLACFWGAAAMRCAAGAHAVLQC